MSQTSDTSVLDAAPLDAGAPPTELTLPDALRMAIEMQQNRLYEGAETLYRRILAAAPGQPDALHFLGMLLFHRGRAEEGVGLIEQAIAAVPAYASAWNNLGNIHASRGDVVPATVAYQRALALVEAQAARAVRTPAGADAAAAAPDGAPGVDGALADLHNNLGALYQVQRRYAEAQAAFERAVALVPGHMRALNNLGLLAAVQGDMEGAIRHYVATIELMPGNMEGRKMLGLAYYASGKIPEAAETFRQWLEIEPAHPVARHMYAACSGQDTPARAPDDYVEYTFDRFATSFEQQLNERLHYQAPQLCAQMLARHLPAAAKQFKVLDAGCGTGLCGPLVAPWAGTLAGVDLSRGMLDQAQTKGVYQDLYKAELTEFLRASPGQWDVIVSADTLCYFGDLGEVMQASAAALRPGGWLVLTVEALADEGAAGARSFHLEPHGRYTHARDHVGQALRAADLALVEADAVVLRQEGGKPVNGWLVAARRAPGAA